MSLNFGFNVGVRSGHHRHPNTVEAAELLQECVHFFGPLCINKYIEKNCASLWSFTKNHYMMHGQQNIKCLEVYVYYLLIPVRRYQ